MAVTTSTVSNPVITNITVDIDCDLTVETVASGNKYLYAVEIVNPNTGPVYLHLINAANSSVVSTAHNNQFYCSAQTSCYYYMPEGFKTATGLEMYCSVTAGGGSGAVAPASSVTVRLGYTAR